MFFGHFEIGKNTYIRSKIYFVHKFLPEEGATLGEEGEGNSVGETEGRLEGRVVGPYKEYEKSKGMFFLQMKIFFF